MSSPTPLSDGQTDTYLLDSAWHDRTNRQVTRHRNPQIVKESFAALTDDDPEWEAWSRDCFAHPMIPRAAVERVQLGAHGQWTHADMLDFIHRQRSQSRITKNRAAVRFLLCELANPGDAIGSNSEPAIDIKGSLQDRNWHDLAAQMIDATDTLFEDAAAHLETVVHQNQDQSGTKKDFLQDHGQAKTEADTTKSMSRLQQLPSELHMVILEHLSSLSDVRSAVCATRCFRDIFTSTLAFQTVKDLLPRTHCSPSQAAALSVSVNFCSNRGFCHKTHQLTALPPTERAHNLLALTAIIIDAVDVRMQMDMQDQIHNERESAARLEGHMSRSMSSVCCDERISTMAASTWNIMAIMLQPHGLFPYLEHEKDNALGIPAEETLLCEQVADEIDAFEFMIALASSKLQHSTRAAHPRYLSYNRGL